jgi:hypothetical protein
LLKCHHAWAQAVAAAAAAAADVCIVVTGPAASGKTTQAALLAQRYGVPCMALDVLLAEAADLPRTCPVRCVLAPWCCSRRGVDGGGPKVTHWSTII